MKDALRNGRLIAAFIALIVLAGAAAWWFWPSSSPQGNSSSAQRAALRETYPLLAEDHRFKATPADEVLRLFTSGSGIVFLGFKECPWCQQLAPIVDEAAKAEQLTVHYLDIRQARADNDATYRQLVEKLTPHLRKDEHGQPRIYVPDVTALRGGAIVGHFLQETTADGEKLTPDTYWTKERRERAVEQLRQMMRQTKAFAQVEQAMKGGAQLLDVRTKPEFDSGHVRSALNLDAQEIAAGTLPEVDKTTAIYLYCRSGNRSAEVKRLLEQAGFTNVKDLGGLSDVQSMGAMIVR